MNFTTESSTLEPGARRQNRRDFIGDAVRFFYAVTAAVMAFPVFGYLTASRRSLTPRDVVLNTKGVELNVTELSSGAVRLGQLNDNPVLVFSDESGPQVLSAVCTHLGCTVKWDPHESKIRCPCHGGVYDRAGKPLSGPVSSPLARIPIQIKNDRMTVERSG